MSDKYLKVFYGTMTGNAEDLATQVQEKADELGYETDLVDLADYPAADLAKEKEISIVISTWGDGDPPDEAEQFCFDLYDGKVDSLAGLKYSIVALGDSSYDDFCGCGRKVDESLSKLGATRVLERPDLDIDFEDGFEEWLEKYVAYLQSK